MSQDEIINFFENLESLGYGEYVTLKKINSHTKCNIDNTRRALNKLSSRGVLELEGKRVWEKKYKLSSKYAKLF